MLFHGPRPSSSQGAPFWPSGLTVRRSRPPTAAAELRALAALSLIIATTGERSMAYRYDTDLEFLGQMKSEDLNDLVYCLTHDKDGSARFTEELRKR